VTRIEQLTLVTDGPAGPDQKVMSLLILIVTMARADWGTRLHDCHAVGCRGFSRRSKCEAGAGAGLRHQATASLSLTIHLETSAI
jgi:hypothetical protein